MATSALAARQPADDCGDACGDCDESCDDSGESKWMDPRAHASPEASPDRGGFVMMFGRCLQDA
ncbi:MAG: hypothetical protein NVS3B10_02030 [Polyangiales bacterium]